MDLLDGVRNARSDRHWPTIRAFETIHLKE